MLIRRVQDGMARRIHISELAARNGFQVKQCLYDDVQKRAIVSAEFGRIEQDMRAGFIDQSIELPPDWTSSQRITATARVRLQRSIESFSTYFKHQSFLEEKEWRLVGIVSANDGSRAKWRTRGNLILPYCCLDIGPSGGSPVPVRRVVIGPGVDPLLAKHSIAFVTFGRQPRIEIETSKCTLRVQ